MSGNNILEEIVACAFRDTRNGKIYLSRTCHAEIIGIFFNMQDKETSDRCEQGFITNLDRFVDRKEALKIAKNAKQELHKRCPSDELYSEDIFYDLLEKNKLEKLEKMIDLMAEHMYCDGSGWRGFDCDFLDKEKGCNIRDCESCIKQYFAKKASEEDEKT